MDWTLNVLTMMGLLISVGLVVDNAIVMVENIHSKRERGLSPKESSLAGASEISLAITMATLTTMVVFIPLLLMDSGGEIRFYFYRIGIPVIASLEHHWE
jgi:multidrug efflux pump subunit AcrB